MSKLSSQQWEALSAERKDLQERGLLPDWYITQGWEMFKNKYMYKGEGEGVRGRFETIAKTLAKHMAGEEEKWEDIFFNLLWSGRLSASSPVLANTGTDRGMNVSCSGQFIGDSVLEFYNGMTETAVLSQHGFGTSGDFSSIRPRGASISKGGKASGPVPVIEDFFTVAAKISQGGTRRGSFAAYLDIEHPDWDEAIDGLMANPDGKNYGWTIKNSFIEKLKAGDKDAHRKFTKALYTKLVTGKGYFFFKDKANELRPQMYKDLGLEVEASNLCVSPETPILTSQGYVEIQTKVNQEVLVWNGEEYSSVVVRKTGENQPLLKVVGSNGMELECTPYHKWYVQEGYGSNVVEKRTHELKQGDKLIKLKTPVIEGVLDLELPYENGFYTGDGCTVEGKQRIYLYGDKRNLAPLFRNKIQHYIQDNNDREYFYLEGLKPKFFVPDTKYTVESRIKWLEGLFDSDGHLSVNGDNKSIQIASVNKPFLQEVLLMLQTLGVHSKITTMREGGTYSLPDGKGGYKDYECLTVYRLLISSSGLYDLVNLGFDPKSITLSVDKPQRNAERFVTVLDVIDEGRVSDTYCFTEPKRHMGVFNGFLTGNCSEIMLHSSPEYTYSCILASMNLVHWDHLKESDDIFNATVFLDCVTEDFIQMSEGIPGLEKVREFTIKGRAIGLGAMGFHTYLQSKGIPFESLEAQFLANDMAKRIQSESLRASQYLAELKGEPEWCKGYGVRNTHRCVTGDTTLLTREGEKPIESLVGKTLEIWNGHEWSEVTPFKTSEKEDVYKVTLSNGVTIKCTPDHKWTIKNNRHKTNPDKVETLDLNIGDKLDKWELPVIEGTQPIPHPYTSGFFAGDGSYNQSKPQYEKCKSRKELRLYERGGKVGCIPYLAVKDGCEVRVREIKRGREIPDKEYRFYLEDSVCEKDFVPGVNHLQNDRLLWLAGLFDADGSDDGTISTADLDFAKEVQKLASLCGLQARISEQQRVGEKQNLNGTETVRKRNIYCIGFSRRELVDKGLDKLTKRVSFGNPNREARQRVTVVSVEYFGQEATYCLTEPKRGTALFNGVKTAQCAYAPTKSSALLMGGVSESWSPDPGMVFEMASSVGELRRIPPVFYEKMKEKGVYNEETITDIINHSGSVQHVDWLTEEEKQVFRNAYEVDQFVILRHASQRQRHTCQGQSLNFFVADQGSEPLIATLMSEVFKDPYILGQYYLYSKSGVVVPEDCVACSA